MSGKKNLVLALAKGYNWYVLEPFMRSFIKNVPNSDMVLFVGDMSPFTLNMLEEVGREFTGGELKLLSFDSDLYPGHPANTRWLAFLDFLKEHGAEYSQVFCPDTRDVFFQADIFKTFADYDSYVGLSYYGEKNVLKENVLGRDSGIYLWFADAFGKEEAEKFADRNTFCPSTIIGTAKEMEILLQTVCDHIPTYDIFGRDECTVDYLMFNDMIPIKNIVKISAETGAIMHFNLQNNEQRTIIENDLVLNRTGIAPDVVHYFDKNVLLMDLTDKLYRSKDFELNENFSDRRSMLDQLPHLVNYGKYDEAFDVFVKYLINETKFSVTFHEKDQAALNKINFSALTEKDKIALRTLEMKGYGDTLIRMWEVLLTNNLPFTTSGELFELALQRALMDSYSAVLPLYRAEKIVACIKIAERKDHTVNTEFKKFILEKLFERMEVFVEDASVYRYLACMDLVHDLNIPLDEKWHQLKYKALSWFRFWRVSVCDDDDVKRIRAKFPTGKVFYNPYRIDADFENGGIK